MEWKGSRKERTMDGKRHLRLVVHFSIKTSCFLHIDSTHFTVHVSIRSWTTLDVQLINRIISLGRWCNVLVSLQRERTGSRNFSPLTRDGERRLELLRNVTVWWEKTKYGVGGWGICNCWKKLRGSPDLSWTKNSYFAFSRVMQDFLVPLVWVWKERARLRDDLTMSDMLFFFFFFVPGNGNCSFLLTRFDYSSERVVHIKRTNRWN